MPARSIFNSTLKLDGASIPIKLYSAIEPRRVGFRLLHADDQVPIRQRMVHPMTGDEVPHAAAQKGLALATAMVVLKDEELAALEPEPSRELEILRFVDLERLDHPWYERPYYVGPADDPEDYFALVRALAAEHKQGIVRWTMRKKSYRGALRVAGDYLVLISLRAPNEIISTETLPELAWPDPSPQELNMAQQLVAMLEGKPNLEEFRDQYAEQVAALAAAKARGQTAELPAPKPKPTTAPSLTEALAASIARLEERNVA